MESDPGVPRRVSGAETNSQVGNTGTSASRLIVQTSDRSEADLRGNRAYDPRTEPTIPSASGPTATTRGFGVLLATHPPCLLESSKQTGHLSIALSDRINREALI